MSFRMVWHTVKHMTIIAMQDIRDSLASIADRVEKGESFVVVRNSKPVFRILPIEKAAYDAPRAPKEPLILREMTERFDAAGASVSEDDVDRIIHEIHRQP
jgi:prevent-host-death family protein